MHSLNPSKILRRPSQVEWNSKFHFALEKKVQNTEDNLKKKTEILKKNWTEITKISLA